MATALPESDADLVALARTGSQDAFSALYERYLPSVYDFLARLLRDRDEAADVAQDTFVKAMEQLDSLEDAARFKSWLFTIAHRRGLNRIRSSKRIAPGYAAVDDDERASMAIADPDPGIDPEQMAEAQEVADIVWEAAAGLDPRTYTVMDLHVRHGLDSAEIADVLGVSKGNAYTMVSRMKDSFSSTLATYLVVRNGRGECPDLAAIVGSAGDELTPELRRQAERHIRRCEVCFADRSQVLDPVKVFAGLLLVPLPASIWGAVAGGAAATAGLAAADLSAKAATSGTAAAQSSTSTSGAGGATGGAAAAAGSTGAGMGLAGTIGLAVAGLAVAAAVVAGIVVAGGGDDPEDVPPAAAAPASDTAAPAEPPSTEPPATTAPPSTVVAAAPGDDPPPTPTTTQPPTPTTTQPPPVVDPPVVPGPGPVTIDEDGVYRFDPLEGAFDPGGEPLVLAGFDRTSAAGGSVVEGSLVYTPPLDYNGVDTFSYTVAAGSRRTTITVEVTLTSVPDQPRPPSGGFVLTTKEDTTATADALVGWVDPDGGSLGLTPGTVTSTRGGSVTMSASGAVTYTPPRDFSGTDTFAYEVTNTSFAATETAAVTVTPVQDRPRVGDLSAVVAESAPVGTVVGQVGVVEPDGDDYTVAVDSDVLSIEADGDLVVAAPLDHETVDVVVATVTVTDETARTGTGTVTLAVLDVNEAPVVEPAVFTVDGAAPVGTVVGMVAFSDPDEGDTVALTLEGGEGLFAVDHGGQLTVAGSLLALEGDVELVVTATDQGGLVGSAPVTVTVAAVSGPEISDVAVDPDTIYRSVPGQACPDDDRMTTLTATVVGDVDSATVTWTLTVGDLVRTGSFASPVVDARLQSTVLLAGGTLADPDASGTLVFDIAVTDNAGRTATATSPVVTVLPCGSA